LTKLPDDPILIRDMKGLIKKETAGGHVSICAPKRRGSYDDAATVVSRLIAKLLPLIAVVDLAGVNRAAAHSDSGIAALLDWKQPVKDGEFAGDLMEAVY
jgi:hypothetical protein